ncbi:hypothetical protein J6590_006939 [Homalodisca vitripennis]|nr:hypothetical protein J6590_006939 [Homalodisca vitripennis]
MNETQVILVLVLKLDEDDTSIDASAAAALPPAACMDHVVIGHSYRPATITQIYCHNFYYPRTARVNQLNKGAARHCVIIQRENGGLELVEGAVNIILPRTPQNCLRRPCRRLLVVREVKLPAQLEKGPHSDKSALKLKWTSKGWMVFFQPLHTTGLECCIAVVRGRAPTALVPLLRQSVHIKVELPHFLSGQRPDAPTTHAAGVGTIITSLSIIISHGRNEPAIVVEPPHRENSPNRSPG